MQPLFSEELVSAGVHKGEDAFLQVEDGDVGTLAASVPSSGNLRMARDGLTVDRAMASFKPIPRFMSLEMQLGMST